MMRRRSRSPLRFESDYRRERSFSISSLSSCSIGKERKSHPFRLDSNDNNDKHKRHSRYHDKNRDRKHRGHEKGVSKDKHREHFKPEERFSRAGSQSSRPNNNRASEDPVDPSICDFRGSESVGMEDDQEHKRTVSTDRLERLEKMMEAIVQHKAQGPSRNTPSEQSDTKVSGELIPRNTNFTTSMWLNKISEECLDRNFDEKTCIKFVESKMTGIVKAWYKTLESYDYTWPELKMLITKSFPDNVEFASTLHLLVSRIKRPDETITQYYFSKMYLIEACKISGANAVSCLIAGLGDPFLQREAKAYNFLTPESLYSQYLCKLPNYGMEQEHEQDQQPVRDQSYEILQRQRPSLRQIDLVEEFPVMEEYVSRPRKYIATEYTNKKCFTCGKFGHITESCRHAPLCYNCGLKGHIAAKCKNK